MLSRTDANQNEIVHALQDLQFKVIDLHKVGRGVPDILVIGYSLIQKRTAALLVEIKTENGKLNEAQKLWHWRMRGEFQDAPVLIARDLSEILEWFGR